MGMRAQLRRCLLSHSSPAFAEKLDMRVLGLTLVPRTGEKIRWKRAAFLFLVFTNLPTAGAAARPERAASQKPADSEIRTYQHRNSQLVANRRGRFPENSLTRQEQIQNPSTVLLPESRSTNDRRNE
jgi:hypothetical protein